MNLISKHVNIVKIILKIYVSVFFVPAWISVVLQLHAHKTLEIFYIGRRSSGWEDAPWFSSFLHQWSEQVAWILGLSPSPAVTGFTHRWLNCWAIIQLHMLVVLVSWLFRSYIRTHLLQYSIQLLLYTNGKNQNRLVKKINFQYIPIPLKMQGWGLPDPCAHQLCILQTMRPKRNRGLLPRVPPDQTLQAS